MKNCIVLLLLATVPASAQKKADRKTLENLQTTVAALHAANGELPGTPGEQRAAAWITAHMQQDGLLPKGDSGFLQVLTIKDARETAPTAQLIINGHPLLPNDQFYALPFSATKAVQGEVVPHLNEPNNIWLVNLATQDVSATRLLDNLRNQAIEATRTGASAVVFYNGKVSPAELKNWSSMNPKPLAIPVLWVSEPAAKKWMGDDVDNFKVTMKVAFEQVHTTATNVLGYIDNGAPQIVIIGAPYHFLTASVPPNDDEASAAAALLELGRLLKASNLHNNNYLLIAFSGEEAGKTGDHHFARHLVVDSNNINYSLKLDRLGGLSPQQGLLIQGSSGCPVWTQLLNNASPKGIKVNYDSSALSRENRPELVFSAPAQPSGPLNYNGTLDIVKMIYHLIENANSQGKLASQP
ncbi:Peptidase family M28 [Chitinophaga costaii]|uniref:Peptidase family M28 n=1 Tax=Chitinophaga costaii TaxID=1335309 RepID=A0A1C4ARU2_9BACT|nr:M28 family peptidase [Chitinophaga costaii]PUZ26719.1 hypothetical protein DCM91_09955 [Chitinophaga costaii]SCB97289.1 Peptidase family M28 [Chitinophaga costaii]